MLINACTLLRLTTTLSVFVFTTFHNYDDIPADRFVSWDSLSDKLLFDYDVKIVYPGGTTIKPSATSIVFATNSDGTARCLHDFVPPMPRTGTEGNILLESSPFAAAQFSTQVIGTLMKEILGFSNVTVRVLDPETLTKETRMARRDSHVLVWPWEQIGESSYLDQTPIGLQGGKRWYVNSRAVAARPSSPVEFYTFYMGQDSTTLPMLSVADLPSSIGVCDISTPATYCRRDYPQGQCGDESQRRVIFVGANSKSPTAAKVERQIQFLDLSCISLVFVGSNPDLPQRFAATTESIVILVWRKPSPILADTAWTKLTLAAETDFLPTHPLMIAFDKRMADDGVELLENFKFANSDVENQFLLLSSNDNNKNNTGATIQAAACLWIRANTATWSPWYVAHSIRSNQSF